MWISGEEAQAPKWAGAWCAGGTAGRSVLVEWSWPGGER